MHACTCMREGCREEADDRDSLSAVVYLGGISMGFLFPPWKQGCAALAHGVVTFWVVLPPQGDCLELPVCRELAPHQNRPGSHCHPSRLI